MTTKHDWHTDGTIRPRTVDGYSTTAVAVASNNSGRAVALVYAGFGDGPEVARLIAAAPELLAALEDLRKQLREHIRLDVKKHYSLMVADAAAGTAIQKATGEHGAEERSGYRRGSDGKATQP